MEYFNLNREAAPLATTCTRVHQHPVQRFNLNREAAPLATRLFGNTTVSPPSFNLNREAAPLATSPTHEPRAYAQRFQSQPRSRSISDRVACHIGTTPQ